MTTLRGISLATFWMLMQFHATPLQAQEAPPETTAVTGSKGVLVMAHGGKEEWEAGILETVRPLRERYPLEVAFGMADAVSLQEAVDRLTARGVRDIAVVRLFISGDSWFDRTAQILGLREGAPPRPFHKGEAANDDDHGMRVAFWELDSDASFGMSRPGLADAETMDQVLLDRARSLSEDPALEDVLILAHGTGDDAENERWLEKMDERAQELRLHGGFHRVQVATLREDWPEKRESSAEKVRSFVRMTNIDGRTPIIIPFRVFGFGPYAEVLDGLDYRSDGRGLIPHPAVAEWIDRQARALFAEMTGTVAGGNAR